MGRTACRKRIKLIDRWFGNQLGPQEKILVATLYYHREPNGASARWKSETVLPADGSDAQTVNVKPICKKIRLLIADYGARAYHRKAIGFHNFLSAANAFLKTDFSTCRAFCWSRFGSLRGCGCRLKEVIALPIRLAVDAKSRG